VTAGGTHGRAAAEGSGPRLDDTGSRKKRDMRVVLGVSGGIAAYKVVSVLRSLTEDGYDVHVVATSAALRFVGEPTWSALSGHPVSTEVWDDAHEVPHVRLGQSADLLIVAPATADLLARAAHGLADDMLTSVLLTVRCPVLMVPAMHSEMWGHPATQANVRTLRERGIVVMEPASGRLTGADSGRGRMPEPGQILQAFRELAGHETATSGADLRPEPVPGPMDGLTVVVSAGGTKEPLDPVRFLGNRSSGRQGVALAETARDRGARVCLVGANLEVPPPEGVRFVPVGSAKELAEAMTREATAADVLVMAAAVADFAPAQVADVKLKKSEDPARDPVIRLIRNPDVLAGLVAARRPGQVIVGFAAETGDENGSVLRHARDKLARKGCDLLVVNDVSGGQVFGADRTQVVVLHRDGTRTDLPEGTKTDVASGIWDVVSALIPGGTAHSG
jgi:phosphopantothenoylcysteine decarboxylase / phosphopantothenate---cysteine ligase